MTNPLDITGQVIGKYTVLAMAHTANKHRYCVVRCICGQEKTVRKDNIYKSANRKCYCGSKKDDTPTKPRGRPKKDKPPKTPSPYLQERKLAYSNAYHRLKAEGWF